ncbi:MAG TPA: hypothetical protein VI278_11190 [Nitrososphaeraceae archaeon]
MKKTNMLIGVAYDNATESEKEFIHEHEFVQARGNGIDRFFIKCINCGTYYCDLCGKSLKNINRGSYK